MSEEHDKIKEYIADLAQKKAEKKIAEAQARNAGSEIRRLEGLIIDAMDKSELTEFGSDVARVTLKESVVPTVKDRDAYLRSVINDILDSEHQGEPIDVLTHILGVFEFRPSTTRYREELELGRNRPGVEPFTKRTLNVTNR